jgi:hypothetical protein
VHIIIIHIYVGTVLHFDAHTHCVMIIITQTI